MSAQATGVQKPSGIIKRSLRLGMRVAKRAFPKTDTLRRASYHRFNLHVWANEYIGRRILTSGRFEEDEIRRFPEYVRLGETCIDVGANIGSHTLNLARAVGPTGKVVAFEPVRRNYLLIQLNSILNGLHNVVAVENPLSDKEGLTLSPEVPTGDSSSSFFTESENGTKSTTLDIYCSENGISEIGFLKIDVEGAEYSVLLGGKALLSGPGRPRCVVVEMVEEYLSRFGHSIPMVILFMKECGYSPYVVRKGRLRAVAEGEVSAENAYFLPE